MPAFMSCNVSRRLRKDRAYLRKHERSDPWALVAVFCVFSRGGMVRR